MHKTNVSCPLCASATFESFQNVDGFDVVRCHKCGMVYVRNPVHPEFSKELYANTYFQHKNSDTKRHFLNASSQHRGGGVLANYVDDKRLQLVRRYLKCGKLLELGCGNGFFLRKARDSGFRAIGIDISLHAVQYASQNLHVEVYAGELENLRFKAEDYDVVVAWHVLEHLPNPVHTLREIFRLLKEGGYLIIEVPNLRSLNWRLRKKHKWAGGLHPRFHRHIFSSNTVVQILNKAGFQVREISSQEIETAPSFHQFRWLKYATKCILNPLLNLTRTGFVLRIVAQKQCYCGGTSTQMNIQ